ncbi:MAG: MEDS domain-containing protein, partial [Candidatus Omnitrophota bacterium]
MVKKNKIVEGTKKMGNCVLDGVQRGIHMCQFYQTKEDLIDVLVPYFKAGLENNEYCMWIVGELLLKDEIIRTMTRNLSQFEHFLITGQIEIIPYTNWFLTDNVFDQHRVLDALMDKLEQALDKGYDGMRVTGDFSPLIEGNWTNLMDYETKVNDSIGENRMTGICTYPLVKCAA